MKNTNNFPPGWDEERVRSVLEYYESQTDDEAVAEAEAAWEDPKSAFVQIPYELLPEVHALLARHEAAKS